MQPSIFLLSELLYLLITATAKSQPGFGMPEYKTQNTFLRKLQDRGMRFLTPQSKIHARSDLSSAS